MVLGLEVCTVLRPGPYGRSPIGSFRWTWLPVVFWLSSTFLCSRDSTIACELLNADVPDIIIKLADVSGEYLDELFGLFASNEVLNPILTSFVTRTLGILICRKPAEVSLHPSDWSSH